MQGRIPDRRAVITGAAKGLGLACAKRFLEEGGRVLLTDLDDKGLAEAVDSLGPLASNASALRCDVSRRIDIEGAVSACTALWGGIDILVNNAGVAIPGDILTIDPDAFDRVLTINLKSAFHGTQIAARRMIDQGTGGVVINMSSVNAVLNIPHLLAYNVSKGGMNQLTKNTAIALAPHKIRVCGIGPGTILTELTRNAVWTDEAARRSILSRTPIGRAGEPEEIASVAAFLASDDASYVTGETIYVDGGRLGLNYTVPTES